MMAKKVILVDDLDETESHVKTRRFTFDGTSYEIDLSDENFDTLRDVLMPYTGVARKIGSAKKNKRAKAAAPHVEENGHHDASDFSRSDRVAMREWARDNGYTVGDRGVVSKEIVTAYRDAVGANND